jgi:hypothetical protein
MQTKAASTIATRAGLAIVLAFAALNAARAEDSYWHGVRSGNWNHGVAGGVSNWYSLPPPSGVAEEVPNGTAIFAAGALRLEVSIAKRTSIDSIRFVTQAPQYSFRVAPGGALILQGDGLANHSDFSPRFVVADSFLRLNYAAKLVSHGPAKSAQINTHGTGVLQFTDQSRGGDAVVTNNSGGTTRFNEDSRSDRMTIINRSSPGQPTMTEFSGTIAVEDRPHLINERDSELVFHRFNGARKVENDGNLRMGFFSLLVATDFIQTENGTLFVVPADGARVGAAGAARLNGRLVVQGSKDTKAGQYTVVQGNAGRIGQFADVTFKNFPPELRGRIRYTPNKAILVIEAR